MDKAAKSLKALGFTEGDRIPLFLSCPGTLYSSYCSRKNWCSNYRRDDVPEELCFAIRKAKSEVVFAMDYTSKEDEELFFATTPMKRMIKVSPYDYADKSSIPEYVEKEIKSKYTDDVYCGENDMTWNEFLALGENYTDDYMAPADADRAVFGAYTSGSTGISKRSFILHQISWL